MKDEHAENCGCLFDFSVGLQCPNCGAQITSDKIPLELEWVHDLQEKYNAMRKVCEAADHMLFNLGATGIPGARDILRLALETPPANPDEAKPDKPIDKNSLPR